MGESLDRENPSQEAEVNTGVVENVQCNRRDFLKMGIGAGLLSILGGCASTSSSPEGRNTSAEQPRFALQEDARFIESEQKLVAQTIEKRLSKLQKGLDQRTQWYANTKEGRRDIKRAICVGFWDQSKLFPYLQEDIGGEMDSKGNVKNGTGIFDAWGMKASDNFKVRWEEDNLDEWFSRTEEWVEVEKEVEDENGKKKKKKVKEKQYVYSNITPRALTSIAGPLKELMKPGRGDKAISAYYVRTGAKKRILELKNKRKDVADDLLPASHYMPAFDPIDITFQPRHNVSLYNMLLGMQYKRTFQGAPQPDYPGQSFAKRIDGKFGWGIDTFLGKTIGEEKRGRMHPPSLESSAKSLLIQEGDDIIDIMEIRVNGEKPKDIGQIVAAGAKVEMKIVPVAHFIHVPDGQGIPGTGGAKADVTTAMGVFLGGRLNPALITENTERKDGDFANKYLQEI